MGLFREGSAHSEAQKEMAQMASSSLEIKDVPKVSCRQRPRGDGKNMEKCWECPAKIS